MKAQALSPGKTVVMWARTGLSISVNVCGAELRPKGRALNWYDLPRNMKDSRGRVAG